MKNFKKALIIAKKRKQEKDDILLCIEMKVCPECASDLDYNPTLRRWRLIENYKCSNIKCEFKRTL